MPFEYLVKTGSGMAAFAFYLYPVYLLQYLLFRGCLSAPTSSYISTQNLTADERTLVPSLLSPNGLPPLNLTLSLQDGGIRYAVPNSQITMYFYLGFRIDELAMQHTIDAARNYCDLQIEMSGDGPLPQTEQPFHDDLGYGASIYVVAVKPRRPITWVLLKGIIQGLWDVLVVGGRYKEAEFHVFYANMGSVGRGTITEAPKAPTSRRSA